MKKDKTIRNSSIELLKIIAMFMIALSHSAQRDEMFNAHIENIAFIRQLGQIGNAIFIVCSAYFLNDSDKNKKEKVINIILDSFCISMIFLIVTLSLGINLSFEMLVKQFIPISLGNNWFITCYLLFYIIHPYLNLIIKNLDKKQFTRLIFGLFVYLVIEFFLKNKLYYSYLIGFVIIYFIVAYMKEYLQDFMHNKRLNFIILITGLLLSYLILIFTKIVGNNISFFSNKILYWNRFINIIFIFIAISSFNIANSIKWKKKLINNIASLSLLFYLIHDNLLFRDCIKPILYDNYFNNLPPYLWLLLEAIILFIGGLLLGEVYKKTFQRVTKILSNKISTMLTNLYINIENRFLEWIK